jgi:hypothetical protein
MPESGQSWQRTFPAEAQQARAARAWVHAHIAHEDAAQIVGELFVAVLAVHPSKVLMTISTSGPRMRLTAAGDRTLPLHSLQGPGRSILGALAPLHGSSPDDRGVWAELPLERP